MQLLSPIRVYVISRNKHRITNKKEDMSAEIFLLKKLVGRRGGRIIINEITFTSTLFGCR